MTTNKITLTYNSALEIVAELEKIRTLCSLDNNWSKKDISRLLEQLQDRITSDGVPD